MDKAELERMEFDALQSEKRDKMNARLQIWSLFFGLVSAFGLVSIQTNAISYLVALYPILALCLARHAGHSESVLDQIKDYLQQVEKSSGYDGYERYNRLNTRRSVGGHKKALRDALLLTELLATVTAAIRLIINQLLPIAVLITIVEIVAVLLTSRFLRETSRVV